MISFNKNKGTLYRWLLKLTNLKDKTHVFISKGSKIINGTRIGDGTRINGKIIIKGSGECIIGKYGAFGDGIRIITSNHKTDDIILQFSLRRRLGLRNSETNKSGVQIGNNVWIGDQVTILPGVRIHDNAIIAAGSVVTQDVSPYAIFAGVPARLIRYRFSKQRIEELENLNWWNWSEEQMRENIHLLSSKEQ